MDVLNRFRKGVTPFASRSTETNPADYPTVKISLADLIRLAEYTAPLGAYGSRRRASMAGNYLTRIKGRGMEFDEVRAYVPGDDVRSLDWRVTARTGKPHTKLFQEERERPVFISIDFSQSMFFGTRRQFKSVLASQLAALFAWRAFQHGDRVGGQLFSDKGVQEIQPRNSKSTLLHYFRALVDASNNRPSIDVDASNPLTEALARLNRHARPGSLVFLLSDFRHFTEEHQDYLLRLNRHCDIVMVFIYDPLEATLPPAGHYQIQYRQQRQTIDSTANRNRQLFEDHFKRRLGSLDTFATKHGIGLVSGCTNETPQEIFQTIRSNHG